jgi:hypothetical protein
VDPLGGVRGGVGRGGLAVLGAEGGDPGVLVVEVELVHRVVRSVLAVADAHRVLTQSGELPGELDVLLHDPLRELLVGYVLRALEQ